MRGKSFIEAKIICMSLKYRYVQNSKHAGGEGDVPVENFSCVHDRAGVPLRGGGER